MAHWDVIVRFGRWGERPAFDRARLRRLLSFLTLVNEDAYREFPDLPSMLGGRVSYELRRTPEGCCAACGACTDGNDVYADALAVVERGSAPCGPLSAAFAAELRVRRGDAEAQCAHDWRETEERPEVHVVTMTGNGRIVDVSKELIRLREAGEV